MTLYLCIRGNVVGLRVKSVEDGSCGVTDSNRVVEVVRRMVWLAVSTQIVLPEAERKVTRRLYKQTRVHIPLSSRARQNNDIYYS